MQPIVPVILSGGVGTRLWPLSREGYPKQFWPLVSQRTMLQETAARASGPAFAAPMVICGEAHRFLVAEQLREAGVENAQIVLEPVGRGSAPAIAVAALLAAEADPAAVLWIMAADAAVQQPQALLEALEAASAAARAGRIATFGIRPTKPETGYGYIEAGSALAEARGAFSVARFVEKPDATTAAAFHSGGRHLWNSGMFVASAGTLIAELERHAPEVLEAARDAAAGAGRDLGFVRLGAGFEKAPDLSIDHAVMERTERAAVVPCEPGWSDVGSWSALWEASPHDEAGNATHGPVELQDAKGCLVRSEGILTAVVGLENVVVVVTDDAVLAVPRERAQEVKKLVERLKAKGRPEATIHRRVYRPWGSYEGLILGDRFQVKKITVRPGRKLSLQKHFHRAEHWVVVGGTAIVERDKERLLLRENESVYLPLGCVHRLENPGIIPLTLIEVQSGPYLGEDDIVRFEDSYGRA
jgi:mannose-1-phosphate guanylyltransferase/mannose-1-phosphate guanylyltransferase/mannose-6-phosphate isomerase